MTLSPLKFLLILIFSSFFSYSSAREVYLLNGDYKFQLGDEPGWEAAGYDDSEWSTVCIPHSFSTPYWGENRFHVGYGWYRKELTVPKKWMGKRISLEFEGVFQECELYVNGKPAGKHQGGYTGFELDITNFVTEGKNALVIRVNNFWNPELAPRAGEHVFSGGIYRDVRLVVKDPLHITWFGTFVQTPEVSEKEATIKFIAEIANTSPTEQKAILETAILDPSGKQIAHLKTPFTLLSGATRDITQDFSPISHPKLWHPDSPYLYKAVSRITVEGKEHDKYETPFGIRWFEFTKDKGFFLNGKHFYILGANVHQDRAGWGDAVTNAAFYRDVKMIKESGMNFIRGSHYPHDPAFSKACDELGILLWSEGVFWGIGGFKDDGYWDSSAYPPDLKHHKKFEQSLRDSLRDMIRIHRNHPSIVIWSMGNEIFFTNKSVMQEAKECTARLIEYSKELDPTRPAGVGGVQREGFDKIGDVAGYNGDGANVKNPVLPSLVAEYGSVVSHRPGAFDPYLGHLKDEPRYPWRSGQVLWCGFHHGSIAGSMGRMGFIDYARLPLRSWFWYRENLAKVKAPVWPKKEKPSAISLTSDKPRIKADGTDDTQIIVSLVDAKGNRVDASQPITLTVLSGPGIFPTGKSITFTPNSDQASVREGWAAIDFRSYHSGKTVITAESEGLKNTSLQLTFTDGPIFVPKKTQEWLPVAAPKSEASNSTKAVECAKSRPSNASHSKENHPSRLGNDGNTDTFWESTLSEQGEAWWKLDLENFYGLEKILLEGPPDNCSFHIEITADEGKTWIPVASKKDAVKSGKQYILSADSSTSYGRFLRVTYTGEPGTTVSQSEISVFGIAR